jgi:hypothetical protein
LEGSASRVLEIVEVSVPGADEEVRCAIPVPVDDGGGGIVSGEDAGIERPLVAEEEEPPPQAVGDLAEQVDVAAVDREVELAIAVPVGQAELASTAPHGPVGIEPEHAHRPA